MKKTEKPKRGRPEPIAPAGYVTIKRAAELAEASYSTVYKYIDKKIIRGMKSDGAWFVREVDVKKIRENMDARGEGDGRHAVMLRPDDERYERWENAADAAGQKVSTWVAGLADAASGGR